MERGRPRTNFKLHQGGRSALEKIFSDTISDVATFIDAASRLLAEFDTLSAVEKIELQHRLDVLRREVDILIAINEKGDVC